MFILIPLLLVLISLAGISIIILRKVPFLKRLSSEVNETSGDLFSDFFPEIAMKFKSVNWREYKDVTLGELEKFLRKIRLVFSKIDRWAYSLIKSVRDIKSDNEIKIEAAAAEEKDASDKEKEAADKKNGAVNGGVDSLKKEEQELIIEIAKNPKEAGLYEKLGDVYMRMSNHQTDAKDSYEAGLKLEPENRSIKAKHSKVVEKIERELV